MKTVLEEDKNWWQKMNDELRFENEELVKLNDELSKIINKFKVNENKRNNRSE